MPDIVMTNTVPEEHQPVVFNAITALGGETIQVRWRNGRVSIEIPNKTVDETQKQYVERVNRRIFWKILQMVDINVKITQRNEEDAARPPIESEIPEDVITATP